MTRPLLLGLLLCAGAAQAGELRARVTQYCSKCDPSGVNADGTRLRIGGCAANPEIKLHTRVWIQGYGTLTVRDRGGAVKKRYCRRGESANFDVYMGKRCPGGCNSGTRRLVKYKLLTAVRGRA